MAFTKRMFSRFPSSSSGNTFNLKRKPPISSVGFVGRRPRDSMMGVGDYLDPSDGNYDYSDVGNIDIVPPNNSYMPVTDAVMYQDADGNWVTDSGASAVVAPYMQNTPSPAQTAAAIQQMVNSSPNPQRTAQAVQQATANAGSGSDWLSTLKTLIPTITQSIDQQKLFAVNLDRAKAGQPPINAAAYTPGFNFGLTPNTKKLVEYGLIGLGAIMLFNTFIKHRRS